jgi:hypothetical protein
MRIGCNTTIRIGIEHHDCDVIEPDNTDAIEPGRGSMDSEEVTNQDVIPANNKTAESDPDAHHP